MADKQDAIQNAKDAALASVSFAVYGTKNDADALRKNSVLAARNVVAVRKNMLLVVAKFQTFNTILANIKSALGKKGDANTKLNAVNAALSAGGNAYALAEAEQESKPSVAGLSAGSGPASGAGLSIGAIAGLAMAIPFLISPEVRDLISGFFTGFLQSLGLSNEAIEKTKAVLVVAAGVIGAVLSVKALAPIVTAFNALKNLAEAMGILGQSTATERDQVNKERAKIDKEKDDIKQGREKGKDEIKKNKDEIKKARKAGKGSRTKAGKLWDKGKYLFEKVAPKLKRMVPNILKAIPILGTVLGIGYILYDLFTIGQDIYDVFFGDDEEDKEQDTEQESAPAAAATTKPIPQPAAVPDAKPAATSTPPTPAAPSMPSAPASSDSGAAPASTATSAPAPAAPSTGVQVATASVIVQQAETDMVQQPIVNIAVVDNTTTVIAAGKQVKTQSGAPTQYSATVGAS